jgi:hypothetical protein
MTIGSRSSGRHKPACDAQGEMKVPEKVEGLVPVWASRVCPTGFEGREPTAGAQSPTKDCSTDL